MGLLNDIANALNSLANLKKAQVEETKVQTQKSKMRRMAKENRELKKALSRNQRIGIATIIITIGSAFIGYYLLVFFPINTEVVEPEPVVPQDIDTTNRPLIAGDQVRITDNSLLFDVKNFGEIPNESGQRKILVVMTNSSEGLTREILSQRPGDVNPLMVIMPSQKISIILEKEILLAIDTSIQSNMDLFLGIVLKYNYGDNKTGEYGYIGKYNPDQQYFAVIESWAD